MALNSYSALFDSIKDTLFWLFLMFILIMLIIATITKHEDNHVREAQYIAQSPPTIEESKRVGLFYRTSAVEPKVFQTESEGIEVDQVWLEKVARLHHKFIWFPYQEVIGYRLCFNLKSGNEYFTNSQNSAHFSERESGALFASKHGGRLFSLTLQGVPKESYSVDLHMASPQP